MSVSVGNVHKRAKAHNACSIALYYIIYFQLFSLAFVVTFLVVVVVVVVFDDDDVVMIMLVLRHIVLAAYML